MMACWIAAAVVLAARLSRLAVVLGPLPVQDGHHNRVDPLAAVPQGFTQHALGAETGFLVDTAGARVERVHLQGDAVHPEPLEAVADDQAGRLGAQPAPATRGAERDAKAAALITRVPLVQHRLADAPATRPVDHRQVEPA